MYNDCIDHGNAKQYANCLHEGKYIGKHVRALMQRTGERSNGREARHLCDNKRCINGEHLVWGSRVDNVRDTVGKAGTQVTSGKVLTAKEIETARFWSGLGHTHKYIAECLGVGRTTITNILNGRRRVHGV